MKTKLLTLMLVFSMVITGAISFSSVAKAANTKDETYEFNNTGTTGYSTWREKHNDTYVYIYPKDGPTISYSINGAKDKDGITGVKDCSRGRRAEIAVGIQASVTNWVNEDKCSYARLQFYQKSYAMAFTRGLWSPDSVGVFKIY